MPPRQSAGSLTQVLVPATPARIEDTPALEISSRNRKPVQSPFTERIVYKKPNRDRWSSRRSAESRASRVNTSFSDLEDEITEMRIKSEPSNNCIGPGVGVHIPRDNILEEDNSLPLTKLEYKLENHELARGTTGKDVSRLNINPASSVDVSSTPVRVSGTSKGKTRRSSERELLSCKAESDFVKVSKQAAVNKVSSLGEEKMRRKSPRKVPESGDNVGRRKNLRARPSDLSELPLSHVKQMRQKIKKSAIIKTKKLKNMLIKKKLNGRLTNKSPTSEVRTRLRERKTEPLPEPAPAPVLDTEFPCLSLTVFDADVARPSRPIHRPVRYLDSLNQNAENIEIKKLSLVDKFDLPYSKESLCWNKSHSKNKQNTYCYCGGPGSWHEKMVRCVRCSQWFHERCLAPRPYTMPVIPGDTAWLFVCSLCNSGSECLKRMDMTWPDLVHLALYDLTLKMNRKFHDFETDLMPHLLKNWSMFQLYKHFNVLSEEEKTSKTMDCLVKLKKRFESGRESGQAESLWGLRTVAPPARPLYRVPDIGIISERTVLDEYSLADTAQHEKNEKFTSLQINKIYKDYTVTVKSDLVNDKCKKVRQTRINPSHTISDSKQLNKLLKAKVAFKPLKLPKEILNDRCRIGEKAKKLPCRSRGGESKHPRAKKSSSATVKPLPFEIARDLHKKGYPKVAMKFASIVPPRRDVVQAQKEECSPEQKTKKKKSKKESKKEKDPMKEPLQEPVINRKVLDCLIPEKPDFLGENNPFQLGSVEAQRKARKMICNRKLKEEDLTRWRSRIKKRTYKLDIEQARKVWRKETVGAEKDIKTLKKHHPASGDKRKSLLCVGTFTSPSGATKMIMSESGHQDKIESQVTGSIKFSNVEL